MLVQFDRPWVLLLFILFAAGLIWAWRQDVRMKQPKKSVVFTLRSLVLICLVLAIAGMQIGSSVERLAVMYVIDRSDSMPEEQPLLDWIAQAEQRKGEDDLSGIVTFGRQSSMERMLSHQPYAGERLLSKVDRNFTNIEHSLRTAFGRLPSDAGGRIVLLTDGLETSGSLLRQGKYLQYAGVPVDVVPIVSAARQDVAVEQVTVPEQLRTGERYPLGVKISSTFQTTAMLRIYENNREIYRDEIEVQSGNNEFVFQSIAGEAGLNRYRVEIYPSEDERSVNNVAYAFSRVIGEPHVLVVSESEEEQTNIVRLLEAASVRFTAIVPQLLPNELSSYTAYDGIVLNNVPATSISQQKMEWIEQAVRDFGVGLMMTGGENSFGLGGYFQTPIERALPVYMDLRGEREIPSLGLVLVIDRSGSMQGSKIELAKEAALRTMELMREEDTLGVVAFDAAPWWAVEPQKLTNRNDVKEKILSIQASGGTEIYSAVLEAFESLTEIEAQRKHIILLTDGHSATSQSYEQLAAKMEEEGITLSTVGIGQGAEQYFLERLAKLGHGRHYFTEDQSTIPAIFSREAVLMTRTYIVDEPFVPQLYQGFDWYRLFQEGVPQIDAYVATTPKETAESVLVSLEPDPLLARWQYGAGKSVAWTSDVNGRWASDWIQWPAFVDVFSEIVQWTFPQYQSSPLSFSSRLEDDEVVLNVQTPDDLYDVHLEAVMSSSDRSRSGEGSGDNKNGDGGSDGEGNETSGDNLGGTQTIQFVPVLPGEFEARVKLNEPGVYLTRIDLIRRDVDGTKRGSNGGRAVDGNDRDAGNAGEEFSDDDAAMDDRGTGGADGADRGAGGSDDNGSVDSGMDGAQGSNGANVESEDVLLGSWTTGFVIPYSPEYSLVQRGSQSQTDDLVSVPSTLKELAEMTGGRVLTFDQADELYNIKRPTVTQSKDISQSLLILALILWVLDIAARRISIPWAQWKEQAIYLLQASKRRRASEQASTGDRFDRLHQRKRNVDARIEGIGAARPSLERTINRDARIPSAADEAGRDGLVDGEGDAGLSELNQPRGSIEKLAGKLGSTRQSSRSSRLSEANGLEVQPNTKMNEGNKQQITDREERLNRLLQAKKRKK